MAYLYAVRSEVDGIKIGFTRDLARRVPIVVRSMPDDAELAMTVRHDDACRLETIIHKILGDCSLGGEKFDCSVERVKSAIGMGFAVLKERSFRERRARIGILDDLIAQFGGVDEFTKAVGENGKCLSRSSVYKWRSVGLTPRLWSLPICIAMEARGLQPDLDSIMAMANPHSDLAA